MTGYLNRLVARLATEPGGSPQSGASGAPAAPLAKPEVGSLAPRAEQAGYNSGVVDPFETLSEAPVYSAAAPRADEPANPVEHVQPPVIVERYPDRFALPGRTVRVSLPKPPALLPALPPEGQPSRRAAVAPPPGQPVQPGTTGFSIPTPAVTPLTSMPESRQSTPPDDRVDALQALRSLGEAIGAANRPGAVSLDPHPKPSEPEPAKPSSTQASSHTASQWAAARLAPAPFSEPLPRAPAIAAPQLVIGRLTVEVISAPAAAAQTTRPRPLIRLPAPAAAAPDAPSRQSFGLGQM